MLDDVVIPMQIAMKGFRVRHDDSAVAFDPQSLEPAAERLRKQRTLAGQFPNALPLSGMAHPRSFTALVATALAQVSPPYLAALDGRRARGKSRAFRHSLLSRRLRCPGRDLSGCALSPECSFPVSRAGRSRSRQDFYFSISPSPVLFCATCAVRICIAGRVFGRSGKRPDDRRISKEAACLRFSICAFVHMPMRSKSKRMPRLFHFLKSLRRHRRFRVTSSLRPPCWPARKIHPPRLRLPFPIFPLETQDVNFAKRGRALFRGRARSRADPEHLRQDPSGL